MGWPTDYAGWIARVKEWLDTSDLPDSSFGYCIDSAHQRLNRDLNSQWMEETYLHTVIDANPIDIKTTLPDYNRMRLVNPVNGLPLYAKALNEFKQEIVNYDGDTSTPAMYNMNAMKLSVWPPASIGAELEIHYYVKVPTLSDVIDTNVFSLEHPDALLYASLVEATPFITEDERLETWTTFYNNIREAVNVTADRANKGSTALKREIKVM